MSQHSATDYSADSDSDSIDNHDKTAVLVNASFETMYTTHKVIGSGHADVPNVLAEDKILACLTAVEKLSNIGKDLDVLLLDSNTVDWQHIEANLLEILHILEAVTTGNLDFGRNEECLECVTAIFDTTFLCALLNIREKFRSTISSSDAHQSRQVDMCWVDSFFAYFPHFIIDFTWSRQTAQTHSDTLPSTLQIQKEEDSLRVACQLPHTLQHFPELLRSDRASPALKRLALCVLFAMFVLRPDLEDCDPWTETNVEPEIFLECLNVLVEEFVCQTRNLAVSEKCPITHHLRTAYALAITLFAASSADAAIQSGPNPAPFQPYSSACLLELIYVVLAAPSQLSSSVIRADDLDDAQSILLHWGGVIPWAWKTWDDPRVIGFDTVVILTSNWLCHLGDSLSITHWDESSIRDEDAGHVLTSGLAFTLSKAVQTNPRASLVALTHQLRNETIEQNVPDSIPDANLLRLYRTAWSLSELIDNCANSLSYQDLILVAGPLALFFAKLSEAYGDRGSKVKEELVHCLKSLRSDVLDKALPMLHNDISFFTKITSAITKASRLITSDPSCRFLLDSAAMIALIALLDYSSLFYRSNAAKCLPTTTFTFFGDLLKVLSQYSGPPKLRVALLNCLVHAYGHCQTSRLGSHNNDTTCLGDENKQSSPAARLHKTWDDEDAYNLALNVVGTNLDLAGLFFISKMTWWKKAKPAFASYVVLTVRKSTDPLLVAEAWDYLRGALFMLTARRLEDNDEERWSTNEADAVDWHIEISEQKFERRASRIADATEKICAALEAILKRSDAVLARMLLMSPPTRSLHSSLERLIKSAQVGSSEANVDTRGSDTLYSPGTEDQSIRHHPRVVKACEEFLDKLKRSEVDLNK